MIHHIYRAGLNILPFERHRVRKLAVVSVVRTSIEVGLPLQYCVSKDHEKVSRANCPWAGTRAVLLLTKREVQSLLKNHRNKYFFDDREIGQRSHAFLVHP
jgi:hypothetical protein